jgi:flavorubredoxin
MIEDEATEKLKKRLQKWGLIVNAGTDKSESKPKSEDKKKADKKGKTR